jgi:hypothetical protein
MFCPKCGKKVKVEVQFCQFCGASLSDNLVSSRSISDTTLGAGENKEKTKRIGKGSYIIIFSSIIILVGAIILLYPQPLQILGKLNLNAPSSTISIFSNPSTQYIRVSDVKLGYNLLRNPPQIVSFNAYNQYSSNLLSIGAEFDGKQYSSEPVYLMPNQSINYEISLKDTNFSTSKTYSIILYFTMQDGKYQTYITSYYYQAPKTSGSAQITQVSLSLGYFVDFKMGLTNTGNTPIIQATFTLGNEKGGFPIGAYQTLNSGQTAQTWSQLWPLSDFVRGTSYPINVMVTYADGSSSSIQTSVIAK